MTQIEIKGKFAVGAHHSGVAWLLHTPLSNPVPLWRWVERARSMDQEHMGTNWPENSFPSLWNTKGIKSQRPNFGQRKKQRILEVADRLKFCFLTQDFANLGGTISCTKWHIFFLSIETRWYQLCGVLIEIKWDSGTSWAVNIWLIKSLFRNLWGLRYNSVGKRKSYMCGALNLIPDTTTTTTHTHTHFLVHPQYQRNNPWHCNYPTPYTTTTKKSKTDHLLANNFV